jgi:hypothetical protein
MSILERMQPQTESLWYRFRAKVLAPVLSGIAMVLLWPLVPLMKLQERWTVWRSQRNLDRDRNLIDRKHLHERLTVEMIEQREMVSDPLNAVPSLPFGHLHPVWGQMKASLRTRDQLWSFSGVWLGRRLGGGEYREGYVVRRWGRSHQRIFTVSKQIEYQRATPRDPVKNHPVDGIQVPEFLKRQAD